MKDYYSILGINREASEQEIKSAYRKLAMQFHPDRNPDNPDAEEKFKEASEAYAILADNEKRSLYDRFGHAGVSGSGSSGFDPAIFHDFKDIFGDFFGDSSRKGGRGQRGADLREDITLEFEESVFGTDTTVTVRRHETCEECRGSGAAPGKAPVSCRTCGGQGQVRYQQSFLSVTRTCPTCQGLGSVVTEPCTKCKGEGWVPRQKTVDAKIPAGIEDGTRIRFTGLGESGLHGGPAGDLWLVLHVKPHPRFQRKGDDLHCVLPISFTQAALGADVSVVTLDGDEKELIIPPETQTGRKFRIPGKGVSSLNSPKPKRGDLIVEVLVQTPKNLTQAQRRFLIMLGESRNENSRSGAARNGNQPNAL
jgi:molecular chaperone DnaJ